MMFVIKIIFYSFCFIFLATFLRLMFDKKFREEQVRKNKARKKLSSSNTFTPTYIYKAHYKNNLNRKSIVWHFLNFLKAYRDFKEGSDDFYTYKRSYEDLIHAKGELRKINPSDDDILIGIRYCQKEYYYGLCDTKIERDHVAFLQNWRELEINYEEAFSRTLDNYTKYWNDVLNDYVQKSPKINRIHYLINDIESLKGYELFVHSDKILQQLNATQEYYKQMLPLNS